MKLIFLLIVIAFSMCGCNIRLKDKVYNNIAEISEFVAYGANDKMSVSFICGKREMDYKVDGYATELVPFGVLTLNLADTEIIIDNVSFILYIGTEKYDGDMEKNPFDDSWVADIGKIVDKKQNISVDVFLDEIKHSLKLKCVDDNWVMDSKGVIGILIRNFSKELKNIIERGVFEGEVYIKIIDDYDKYCSDFYYYVSVVGRNGKGLNILISPETSEILASNSFGLGIDK